MEKLMPSTGEFEKEWVMEFHGTNYEINLGTTSSILTLDIEQEGTNDKWSADFTSQYVEEITHKAGNFKKFETFVMMLTSAFSRESDAVYVDLLTYNDLEIMKARKVGSSNASMSSVQSHGSSSSRSSMKRYVILTYNSEFDRVHFPLPLSYEENPSVESLQRTVFRLKRRARERAEKEKNQLVSVKESHDLKFIDSQLRQENTELRHRLRQHESKRTDAPSTDALKLKKLAETSRRLLSEKCAAYDRLKGRAEAMEARLAGSEDSGRASARELQSKVRHLQSMLDMERLDHRKEVTRLKRELADTRRSALYGTSRSRSSVKSTNGGSRSRSAGRDSDGGTRGAASSSRNYTNTTGSWSQSGHRSRSPLGNPAPPRSSTAVGRSKASGRSDISRGYGESSGYGQSRRGSSGSTSARASRTTTSRSPVTKSRGATGTPRGTSRSRSPSSSLGGVFDPTAYALEKAEKKNRLSESRGRAWGAGSTRDRYSRESGYNSASSGYNSATSQSSNGSGTSRRSSGSRRSVTSTQSAHGESTTKKITKKPQKSKKSSKSKSPTRKRKTKLDNFNSHVGIGMKGGGGSGADMAFRDGLSSSVLDLHQAEQFHDRHRDRVRFQEGAEGVLQAYLQGQQQGQQRQLQQDVERKQQVQQQQQLNELQQRHDVELQHLQQASPLTISGKPPLRVASSQPREHYPIDDIEDDSEDSFDARGIDTVSAPGAASDRTFDHAYGPSDDRDRDQDTSSRGDGEIQSVASPDSTSQSLSRLALQTQSQFAPENTLSRPLEQQQHQHQHQERLVVPSTSGKENLANAAVSPTSLSVSKRIGSTTAAAGSDDGDGDSDGDVTDIDRRLSDLQKFLDKARSGILSAGEDPNVDSDA